VLYTVAMMEGTGAVHSRDDASYITTYTHTYVCMYAYIHTFTKTHANKKYIRIRIYMMCMMRMHVEPRHTGQIRAFESDRRVPDLHSVDGEGLHGHGLGSPAGQRALETMRECASVCRCCLETLVQTNTYAYTNSIHANSVRITVNKNASLCAGACGAIELLFSCVFLGH
jgi:hypothetical protein